MFCVLEINERKNTLKERLFGKYIKDEYNIKTVNVFKGAPFYIIEAEIGRGKAIDWQKITFLAGKCANRILCDRSKLPESENLRAFQSDMLYKKAMINTFLHILNNSNFSVNNKTVNVFDSKGENDRFVYDIAKFASKLTVVTDNKKKYEDVCEKILEDTGLCVTVQSSPSECEIAVNCDTSEMKIKTEYEIIKIGNGKNLNGDMQYAELLPTGIDEYDFYSALYELCGVFSLGNCIFTSVDVNREKKSTDCIRFS